LFAAARTSTQRFPLLTGTYEALTSLRLTHCGQSATGHYSCLRINISYRENGQDNGTFTKRKNFVRNPQEHPLSRSVTNEGERGDMADEKLRATGPETAEIDVEPWPYWVEPEA
jgi:hypothetical protein